MEKIINLFKESKSELDRVIFPTKTTIKEVFINVIIMTTIISGFLLLIDIIIKFSLNKIL